MHTYLLAWKVCLYGEIKLEKGGGDQKSRGEEGFLVGPWSLVPILWAAESNECFLEKSDGQRDFRKMALPVVGR